MVMPAYLCGFLACCLASAASGASLDRYEFTEVHMGVAFKLSFYAHDPDTAKVASRAAFDRVAELNRLMSDYDRDSELMRLCRTAGQGRAVPVSRELFEVLQRSQRLSGQTDGAFDVTVGPIVRLWRRARRRHQLPSEERLAEARALVGYEKVRLDHDARTVELLKPGMRLDLGGIAKGYAADEALSVLRQHGIARALVDASGDLAIGDPPPGRKGWRIAIAPLAESNPVGQAVPDVGVGCVEQAKGERCVAQVGRRSSAANAESEDVSPAQRTTPRRLALRTLPAELQSGGTPSQGVDVLPETPPPPSLRSERATQPESVTPHSPPHTLHVLLLANVAVATSGDLWQFVEIDGTRYSHLVDPHTGLGLTDHSSVTVVAPDCTTADSLASAVSVLGPERGLELIEQTPGTAAYIERAPEGKIESYESSRFRSIPEKN